ncbi:MAG: hypothetical protein R3C11_24325 [Planctomycetaceae bacterium]
MSIPTNAVIKGIQLTLTTSATQTPDYQEIALSKDGTSVFSSKSSPTSGSWMSGTAIYGGATDLWGASWTPADINATTFGSLIKVWALDGGDAFGVYAGEIEVFYEIPYTPQVTTTNINFTLNIADDLDTEGTEHFLLNLANPQTTSSTDVVVTSASVATTIEDDETTPAAIAFDISGRNCIRSSYSK